MSSPVQKLAPTAFPKLLSEITDPPKQLYMRGSFPSEDLHYLCVVGSRKFTSYGKAAVEHIIEGLRGYPVGIVSGLALGIDGIAHRAALDAGLITVAVPGSGVSDDALHPRTNFMLAQEILGAGGALLSEYEPDTRPAKWTFPRRNRIMAGLSHAILIVEAGDRSGTLITARLATEYNRDVCAVPGSILSENSSGPNRLIRDGATPILSAGDILEVFDLDTHVRSTDALPADISDEERYILSILSEPKERDELVTTSNMSAQKAGAILSFMELKGFIKEEAGVIRKTI